MIKQQIKYKIKDCMYCLGTGYVSMGAFSDEEFRCPCKREKIDIRAEMDDDSDFE